MEIKKMRTILLDNHGHTTANIFADQGEKSGLSAVNEVVW